MKPKLTSDKWQVTSDELKDSTRSAHNSSLITHNSRSGIALVITLIMLSVTLVMAIAFIAVSRRARNASTTGTDSTVARLAADAALAAAQAQIVANIFVTNASAYDFRLLVSTNYINSLGFDPSSSNPTNINYDYLVNGGGPLTTLVQRNQNIANLFFLPRAPVIVTTNNVTGANDFRFYLDLNRNRNFENTGYITNVDNLGNALPDGSGNAFVSVIGDPQWVGILERPDSPHSPDNHFVARYAFFAQPIGNSLDLNAIHNQTLSASAVNPFSVANDGYFRNESIGSWELNLASFLADLNTNQWNPIINPYLYRRPGLGNIGAAFEDAQSILSWRYGGTYSSLDIPSVLAYNALVNAGIDGYNIGDLMTNTLLPSVQTPINRHWVGSDNTNHFYSLPSELFDASKSSASFVARLQNAGSSFFGGTTNSTYDRYTFYRLLEQLGTDSTVDDSRMNLNYDNITRAFNGVANPAGTSSATNLLAWTPLTFFTNAADRMLTAYTTEWLNENTNAFYNYTNTFGTVVSNAFGVTHIPVYVDGRFVYTPAVNRLLQLAANLYDATTNDVFPSVFRPLFTRTGTNVFITGYVPVGLVAGPLDLVFSAPTNVESFAQIGGVNIAINLYGVPWIIGAKKNLPAFNKFYSYNLVALTRKLQVWRSNPSLPGALETNQMFVMSITNRLGASFWNSYNSDLTSQSPLGYTVVLHDKLSMILSNQQNHGLFPSPNWPNPTPRSFDFQTNLTVWPGSGWGLTGQDFAGNSPQPSSFILTNFDSNFLPESIFYPSRNQFFPVVLNPDPGFERPSSPVPVFPQFLLMATNDLQAFILDGNRVIDYVHLSGPNSVRNLNDEIADKNSNGDDSKRIIASTALWATNVIGNSPAGVGNQVFVSKPNIDGTIIKDLPGGGWKKPGNLGTLPATPENEAAFFSGFFRDNFQPYPRSGFVYTNSEATNQVPYTPTRYVYDYTYLQANDPMVHYLYSDLINFDHRLGREDIALQLPQPDVLLNILGNGEAKSRYQPWGRYDQLAALSSYYDNANPYNYAYRDSLVWGSDFWDFPTNKFPSAGWIGRVHRGTPWQTVFLKATNILDNFNGAYAIGTNTWNVWTGNQNTYDNVHSAPVDDRLLFDLFTAAPNDNAQRGALSINQTQLASLSALFSGMVVLTNDLELPLPDTTPTVTNMIISPAGVDTANSVIKQIQNSIVATRMDTNLFPQGVFKHVGDILRVPALTQESPFLNRSGDNQLNYNISDELYEWLPQQTMGLLRLGTPRFVVYCYGQALKPAQNGTVLGGTFSQLVTNYQVVSESATRVVLRVDDATGTNGSPRVVIESSTPLAPQ